MKLSLCIATFNEEKFIYYPMESAYDLADEVIIVDGGSSDKTVEVAKSYGPKVRVISTNNPSMFHLNKQKAIEAAKGEWILQLDADEALSEKLKEEIKKAIGGRRVRDPDSAHLPSPFVGRSTGGKELSDRIYRNETVAYWIPRKNYFLGRFLTKGGVYPDFTIRLYKNGVARFPCKSVHENVEVKGSVGYLKNPLLHYADPSFSRYLKRWQRYTGLDAGILIKNKQKPNVFDYLIIKPFAWFSSAYFRHLGFLDGWQGFVFHFMSSIRFWAIYAKYSKIKSQL